MSFWDLSVWFFFLFLRNQNKFYSDLLNQYSKKKILQIKTYMDSNI